MKKNTNLFFKKKKVNYNIREFIISEDFNIIYINNNNKSYNEFNLVNNISFLKILLIFYFIIKKREVNIYLKKINYYKFNYVKKI